MKKMRGIIDPYTLGFLISIVGALTFSPIIKNDSDITTTAAPTSGLSKAQSATNHPQY